MFQVFTPYASETQSCLLSNTPQSDLDLGAGLNCQGLGQGALKWGLCYFLPISLGCYENQMRYWT